MYLMLMSILLARAQEIQLKYYSVLNEIHSDKEWMIEGDGEIYYCKAKTSCDGFADSDFIIAGRSVWYDPIIVFHVKGNVKTMCSLETCTRSKPLTYNDLKWGRWLIDQ